MPAELFAFAKLSKSFTFTKLSKFRKRVSNRVLFTFTKLSKFRKRVHNRALLLTYCLALAVPGSAQVGRAPEKDSAGARKAPTAGNPKIVKPPVLVSGNIGCGIQDRAGNLWFGTGGAGVYRYDGTAFVRFTEQDGLPSDHVTALIEDKKGNILAGTKAGLCRYDGHAFVRPTENEDAGKNHITSLLEDRHGNLWFGTKNSGVYRYDGQTFTNFLNGQEPAGSKSQLILDILQDRTGNIWFCSWNGGGVWRYDGQTFENFSPPTEYYRQNEDGRSSGEVIPTVPDFQPGDRITDDMIFSISEDKAGNLWFATRDHGACRYDGTYFTPFRENEGFLSRGAYAVLEDKKGYLWFATDQDGVWRYDGKSCTQFTTADGLVNNSVFCILEDKNGNLWFGTRGFGLSRFDGKTFITFSE